MLKSSTRIIVIATTIGTLAACGGTGEVNSTPPPPPEAPPPPPPPPPPPTPPADPTGPVGLVSPEPFAVLAVSNSYAKTAGGNFKITGPDRATVTLRYRESDGKYVIGLPGFREGELVTTDYSGAYNDSSDWVSITGTNNDLRDGSSGRQDAQVFLRWAQERYNRDWDYSYTSWGSWGDDLDVNGTASSGENGYFVYGIPTAASNVPTTGTATYDAMVLGMTDGAYRGGWITDYITGTARLRFDFGEGKLSGEMRPEICPWDCYKMGVYTFVNTVYSSGSTSFSGQFSVDGRNVDSWFEGNFTGPKAEELMARWRAPVGPVDDILAQTAGGEMMGGVWIGKKN